MPVSKARKRIGLAALATLLAPLMCELGFRASRDLWDVEDWAIVELRNYVCRSKYRFAPRAHVGWVRRPNPPRVNRLGFFDTDFELVKPSGGLRIACLGGSTTAGGNMQGRTGSYPHHLEQLLGETMQQKVDVMNWGMSGWTSAETLINYCLNVQDYRPDVVIIHHAINDVHPRGWRPFKRDYSHYFRPWTAQKYGLLWRTLTANSDLFAAWQLRRWSFQLTDYVSVGHHRLFKWRNAQLEPETAAPFRRNISNLVALSRGQGASPVLMTQPWARRFEERNPINKFRLAGIREHNEILRQIAREEGIPLIDMERLAASERELTEPRFVDMVHLDSEGNRIKAETVAHHLNYFGLLER